MSTKNIKQLIKAKGDNTFERAMRMYGIKPKEAEKIFKSTDWADVDNGGGSGGGESASTIEYLDVSGNIDGNIILSGGVEVPLNLISYAGITYKVNQEGVIEILPILNILNPNFVGDTLALAVDFSTKLSNPAAGGLVSVKEFLINFGGITEDQLASIPRLTKEQFYDLNA